MRQARPAWTSGIVSAAISEKTVMISAARTIGRRHSAWERRRIAEIITPAWLMPTQNTKLVMKKPQNTGWRNPVTPSPWLNMKPTAMTAAPTTSPSKPTSTIHHIGVVNTTCSSSRLICASLTVRR